MVKIATYSAGTASLNSASAITEMIKVEMTFMFNSDVFLEYLLLFERKNGMPLSSYIEEVIKAGRPLDSLMYMIEWEEMSVGESEFSAFDDLYYELIDSAKSGGVLTFKKSGKIIKEVS